ncbi:restriction endonuclease subunit S [Subtercola sp. RTI3]|uniref:restriction endonuclease subunit S n=1 Tax=Subtercola sp. RTI3 TaxID=3048639 RepID=UPI002B227165|nr:restriction endonuclease subunit S [Subtercola sp. RTI3]MEA9984943.1 restriction endonuclease subunit S [Subtercola sp. RTI3]
MEKIKLTELFTIESSIQDDKINFQIADINDVDALPFISRTARNNGITDYCSPRAGMVNKGGAISLALDGSTGSTFYQHHDFLSGQNIWLLRPIVAKVPDFSPRVALYLVSSIRKAVSAYTYNLSLTKTRLQKISINVPLTAAGTVDADWIRTEMFGLRHIELLDELPEERYQILT